MIFPQLSDIIYSVDLTYLEGLIMKRVFNYEENVGKRIGKWLILAITYTNHRIRYVVQCECGQNTTTNAYSILRELIRACKKCANTKHGYNKTPTNRCWNGAKNRCRNPNNKDYVDYGGRGIQMCERWNQFENFLEDMGEKPEGLTLDRIDNNGHYEPGNCRWATMSQQNSNQRKRKKSTS